MPYGRYFGIGKLRASTLQGFEERRRLPVMRRMGFRRTGADVRLKREVAQVFLSEHAQVVGVSENLRHGQRHRHEQVRHVHERQRVVVEGRRVDREHERVAVAGQHAKVASIGSVARQRHDACRLECEAMEVLDDRRGSSEATAQCKARWLQREDRDVADCRDGFVRPQHRRRHQHRSPGAKPGGQRNRARDDAFVEFNVRRDARARARRPIATVARRDALQESRPQGGSSGRRRPPGRS